MKEVEIRHFLKELLRKEVDIVFVYRDKLEDDKNF